MIDKINIFWLNIKKYWLLLFTIISFIIGFVLLRKKSISLLDTIKQIDELHQQELDSIKRIRDEEIAKNEEARKKSEEEKRKISEEYEKIKQEIEMNKKNDIKRIIDNSKDDPNELAKELQEVTKFKIIK
jgi:biopolymer transport protein ExbB/TolQ